MKGYGLIRKFKVAFQTEDASKIAKDVFGALKDKSVKKADFALDIIYKKDPDKITTPEYIAEGLAWLESELSLKKHSDFLNGEN